MPKKILVEVLVGGELQTCKQAFSPLKTALSSALSEFPIMLQTCWQALLPLKSPNYTTAFPSGLLQTCWQDHHLFDWQRDAALVPHLLQTCWQAFSPLKDVLLLLPLLLQMAVTNLLAGISPFKVLQRQMGLLG